MAASGSLSLFDLHGNPTVMVCSRSADHHRSYINAPCPVRSLSSVAISTCQHSNHLGRPFFSPALFASPHGTLTNETLTVIEHHHRPSVHITMPHAAAEQLQPTIAGVHLRVNDGPLDPSSVRPLRASHPSEPLAALRERYAADGYLFLKGLLPRDDVLAARAAYFTSLAPTGVLKPGTAPVDGIFDAEGASAADFPGIGAGSVKNARPGGSSSARSVLFTDAALRAHTEPWYAGGGSSEGSDCSDGSKDGGAGGRGTRGFARHPALYDFVARFSSWGEDTLAVRRSLLRNNTPGNRAIGVHYDQSFMRYGEPTSVTAWVPMGDVRLEGGGLIYLEGGASPSAHHLFPLPRTKGGRCRSPPREDSTKQLTDDMRKGRRWAHRSKTTSPPRRARRACRTRRRATPSTPT